MTILCSQGLGNTKSFLISIFGCSTLPFPTEVLGSHLLLDVSEQRSRFIYLGCSLINQVWTHSCYKIAERFEIEVTP